MPRACWNCPPFQTATPPLPTLPTHTMSTPCPGLPAQTTGSAYHTSPLLFWKVACVCLVTARVSCPHTLPQTQTHTLANRHTHTPCLFSERPGRQAACGDRPVMDDDPCCCLHLPPRYASPYIPQCLIYMPTKKDKRKDDKQEGFWQCSPLVTSGL